MSAQKLTMQERDNEDLRNMIHEMADKVKDQAVLARVWLILQRAYAKQ